jgi:hypothetical protein
MTRVRTLLPTLLLAALLAVGMSATASAAEMMMSSGRHMAPKPFPKVTPGYARSNIMLRTLQVDPADRGTMVAMQGTFASVTKRLPEASGDCQQGRLKRFGGGIITIGNRSYPAALPRDMIGTAARGLAPGMYIFRFEGSSACEVLLFTGK